jgi:hypothetical protein
VGKARRVSEIRIPSFGGVTGLIFEKGGYAEVLMTWPELYRLLRVWMAHEERKSRPDEKLIGALEVLCRKAHRFDAAIVAEVPIAQWKAKITPILRKL